MTIAKTIGELRTLIADSPADLPIYPSWFSGPPSAHEPGVSVHGAELTAEGLQILVDIFYLGDLDAEDVEYKAVEYLVEYIDGTRQGPFRIRSDAEEHADATDGIVIEVPSSAEANKGEEEDE